MPDDAPPIPSRNPPRTRRRDSRMVDPRSLGMDPRTFEPLSSERVQQLAAGRALTSSRRHVGATPEARAEQTLTARDIPRPTPTRPHTINPTSTGREAQQTTGGTTTAGVVTRRAAARRAMDEEVAERRGACGAGAGGETERRALSAGSASGGASSTVHRPLALSQPSEAALAREINVLEKLVLETIEELERLERGQPPLCPIYIGMDWNQTHLAAWSNLLRATHMIETYEQQLRRMGVATDPAGLGRFHLDHLWRGPGVIVPEGLVLGGRDPGGHDPNGHGHGPGPHGPGPHGPGPHGPGGHRPGVGGPNASSQRS